MTVVVVQELVEAEEILVSAAHESSSYLLIVLARPMMGFTMDAAIAGFVGAMRERELESLRVMARTILGGAGIAFEVVLMQYRGSNSSARRVTRIAGAVSQLVAERERRDLLDWQSRLERLKTAEGRFRR